MTQARRSVSIRSTNGCIRRCRKASRPWCWIPARCGATLEDGLACVEALRRAERENLIRELKTQIKAAEREGRINDALDLAQQLQKLTEG